MKLSLAWIASALGLDQTIEGVADAYAIDSREVGPGALFFALPGERTDGHSFVPSALDKGASACVVRRDWRGDAREDRLLRVKDPAEALRRLGRQARLQWGGKVIAVTGSNGKTTTKDALAVLLAAKISVSKTTGNLNNELGVPLTLLRIEDEAKVAVVEAGMNHAGELRRLAAIAQPDAAVVTNVSPAHVGHFDSVEGVALAKRELIEGLVPGGTAVLNADDVRVREFATIHDGPTVTFGESAAADLRISDIVSSLEGSRFTATFGGESTELESGLPGRHNVWNVAAALASATVVGFRPSELRNAVKGLRAAPMRGGVSRRAGVTVIDESYNSNPAAVAASLALLESTRAARRIAVLGEMRELGDQSAQLHLEAGRGAAFVDRLLAVAGDARCFVEGAVEAGLERSCGAYFETAEEAGVALSALLKPEDAVLFKGSRGVGLELAIERAFLRSTEAVNG